MPKYHYLKSQTFRYVKISNVQNYSFLWIPKMLNVHYFLRNKNLENFSNFYERGYWHKPVSTRSGLFGQLGWKKSTQSFCFRMSLIYIFCLVLVTLLVLKLYYSWLSPLRCEGCSLWTSEALSAWGLFSGQGKCSIYVQDKPGIKKQLSTKDEWGVKK